MAFDENYPEGGELAKLFGFERAAIAASASYTRQLTKALASLWEAFPAAVPTPTYPPSLFPAPSCVPWRRRRW